MPTTAPLTDHELQLLHLAGAPLHLPGQREHAIHEQLALTPTQFWQRVNALLDDERALAHDPALIYRLRRVRERNRPGRSPARRLPPAR